MFQFRLYSCVTELQILFKVSKTRMKFKFVGGNVVIMYEKNILTKLVIKTAIKLKKCNNIIKLAHRSMTDYDNVEKFWTSVKLV